MKSAIVVPALQEVHAIGLHHIYATMLEGDPTRPDIAAQVFQWLRFANACKRILEDGLDEL
jgi:hypothetical protein